MFNNIQNPFLAARLERFLNVNKVVQLLVLTLLFYDGNDLSLTCSSDASK